MDMHSSLQPPLLFLADAQGLCDFDLMAELIPVSGLVQAEGIIFSSLKAPFSTVEEMIGSKANPGKVSVAVDSLTDNWCSPL